MRFAVGDRVRFRRRAGAPRGVWIVREAVGESCVVAPEPADEPRHLVAQVDLEPADMTNGHHKP